jgi:ABC-2 type transport system permease protein
MASKSAGELRKEVLEGTLDGYLLIPKNVLEEGVVNIYTKSGSNLGFINNISSNLNRIIKNERLAKANVDPKVIEFVERDIDINSKKLTEEGTEEDYSAIFAGVGYVFGFIIYALMFIYGAMVMRGVIEEKANRIVEVIASSAKPFEIMMGKVVGIGAVGLTQVLFWIILSTAIFALAGTIIGGISGDQAAEIAKQAQAQSQGMGMGSSDFGGTEAEKIMGIAKNIPVGLIIGFVFYFLAGYFIYSTLFAAVGSAVDQEQDAAQLQTPIMIPIIVPILFIFEVMSNPDSTMSVVLSLIPFFTPILMIVRIAATEVPVWQIILSVVLLLGTFFGTLWLASRIYRVGILMYGKKPSFKDITKWIKG